MKALHIHASGDIYGAEMVIFTLVKEQIKNGIEVRVICLERSGKDSFSKKLESSGIPVYKIVSKGRMDLEALIKIKRICEEFAPHILHSHDYKSDFFLAILKKFLVKRSILLISTKHGWTSSHWRVKLYEAIDDFILRTFDKIVAVSNHMRLKLISKGISPSKVQVIYNGVDLSVFNHNGLIGGKLRNELCLSKQCNLIGFIGRLSPEKGIRYLLEVALAMNKMRENLYFLLVGDGPLRKEVEYYVNTNKLSNRVFILGRRDDVCEILADLDIVILPSLREGTPMVLLEAMSMRKPVVATEVGGVKEVIKNLETGLLVKSGDSKALIEALWYLLENETIRNQIGNKAYEVVRSKFSSEIMARKYMDTYNELLRDLG